MIGPRTPSPAAAADDGWPMTIDEYRELEESDDRKWEYFAGRAFPWTGYEVSPTTGIVGASLTHVRLQDNVRDALRPKANAAGCDAWSSEVRFVYDVAVNRYYYADVMVGCEPPIEFEGAASLSAPCIAVEVLSRSNQRGTGRLLFANKLLRYVTTPSVQTLLLIEQDRRLVHVYSRLPDGRMSDPQQVGEGAIALPCINATLSLDEIYRNIID
jgi:Uma2 family endonuclease